MSTDQGVTLEAGVSAEVSPKERRQAPRQGLRRRTVLPAQLLERPQQERGGPVRGRKKLIALLLSSLALLLAASCGEQDPIGAPPEPALATLTWRDRGFSVEYPRDWFAGAMGRGVNFMPPVSGCRRSSTSERTTEHCQEETPFWMHVGDLYLDPPTDRWKKRVREVKTEYKWQAGLGRVADGYTNVDGRRAYFATFHQLRRPPAGTDGVPACKSCLHERSYVIDWHPRKALTIYIYGHSMRAWKQYIDLAEGIVSSVEMDAAKGD